MPAHVICPAEMDIIFWKVAALLAFKSRVTPKETLLWSRILQQALECFRMRFLVKMDLQPFRL